MESITRVNGNGQKYTTELPTIHIMNDMNDAAIAHIEENTGLKFERNSWNQLTAKPVSSAQIVGLLLTYNFKTQYHSNATNSNTLFLKSDHHVGFQVDSICFECVKHNRIATNGLEADSRLAC